MYEIEVLKSCGAFHPSPSFGEFSKGKARIGATVLHFLIFENTASHFLKFENPFPCLRIGVVGVYALYWMEYPRSDFTVEVGRREV